MIEVIHMSAEIIGPVNPETDMAKIETMARTCYASPMSESPEARDAFIRKLVQAGHVPALEGEALIGWRSFVWKAAELYNAMIASGVKPQVARSILPNCAATKLGMTANLRAWRHILRQRWTDPTADPAIREVMGIVGKKLIELYPPVFGDIGA